MKISMIDASIIKLLESISKNSGSSFTGLGIIFYRELNALPISALGDESLFQPELPIVGEDAIAQTLMKISQKESDWHDGFHLIEYPAFKLTHICQYVAPSLDLFSEPYPGALPVGARHKSAMAMSKITFVECTALISSTNFIEIFSDGTRDLACRT